MIRRLSPGMRSGAVRIPSSKSQAHRLLICAALGTGETRLLCDGISRDIAATVDCLRALGAKIEIHDEQITVRPIAEKPSGLRFLPCGESGSTLRFLLPIAGALGAEVCFQREGRLPQRPLEPLDRELCAHGMHLESQGAQLLCCGQLEAGDYRLPGNVSSQYISGLLLALPLLKGDSRLQITGPLESAAYVTMTEDALRLGGVRIEQMPEGYRIPGKQRPALPGSLTVEGDYSNASFFLCMGALSERGVRVEGLWENSSQGDRAILDLLRAFGAEIEREDGALTVCRGTLKGQVIDASPIPDLIPVLSVLAALSEGETQFVKAGRLRLKESDRLESTARMLHALGGDVTELPEGLVIRGKESLSGGTVDACGDHRIAMSAAVAACASDAAVTVEGAGCVEKSYPRFWRDFDALEVGRA